MFAVHRSLAFVVMAMTILLSHAGAEEEPYDPFALPSEPIPTPIDLVVKDAARSRQLPLRVYLPASARPAPVAFFSHGLGGSRAGSAFFGQHWAARGYVVVFVQHPGSDESLWRDKPFAERLPAMRRAANLENFALRVKDIPVVLDELKSWHEAKDHALFGRLDLAHIGMSGHSFGAVTTQAVSGQRFPLSSTSLTDKRIKAAIAFSPSSPRAGDVKRAFGDVKIPWLLMTGTRDVAPIGEQTVESRLSVFPALPAGSKYELVLKDAEHSVFTERRLPGEAVDRNPNHRRAIVGLSTAFWDAYLRDDAAAKAWLDGDGPKALLEAADRWQKK